MNDTESRIRELVLRPPGMTLDQRVRSIVQNAVSEGVAFGGAADGEARKGASSVTPRLESQTGGVLKVNDDHECRHTKTKPVVARTGIVVTSSWIVAAVSLLVGICVGRWLPSTRTPGREAAAIDDKSEMQPPGRQSAQDGHLSGEQLAVSQAHPMIPEIPKHLFQPPADSVARPSAASQIAESIWLSSRDAAIAWERQTGQFFSVATHLSDRRFDMCRDCHRIGG